MILNAVIAVVDRDRAETYTEICAREKLPLILNAFGRGTATDEHLDYYGLEKTEKAIIACVADEEKTGRLMKAAKRRMFMDIPGNGIMSIIPVKSVGGGRSMSYLSQGMENTSKTPSMNFPYELIVVILNRGYIDEAMASAREAGATGGTVIHARNATSPETGKFMGISISAEKDVILIAAKKENKSQIMEAIIRSCGPESNAGAITFSMPVSELIGLRRIDE